MTTLYIRDNKGAIRFWRITADYSNGRILIDHGQVGGKTQSVQEIVPTGKVKRTRDEQIDLQIQSRINKQLDRGYSENYDKAKVKPVNPLGLPKPMLAKTFDSRIVVGKNSYVQRKYDGNRCIIGNVGDRIVAYSRNGKEIEGITHITDNIRLEEDQFVDGELYCHGESLQTIVSWIKRKQPGTVKLEYVMYDVISPLPFHERLQIVNSIRGKHCYSADTHKVSNEQKVMEYFETFRKEGYEGAILRVGENGYEDGKRSSSLLKIKAWVDSEFRVTDIQASKDGWAILVCQTYSGKLFTVSCHGTIEYKTTVLEQKELFIGSYVTVEYAYLTAEGIPFHPVAKNWR